VQAGEECDDGDTDDSNACMSNCRLPVCGDQIISGSEECDDGNDVDDDECTNSCTQGDDPTPGDCGNGVVDDGEECDDGGETATCDPDCTFVECGDGYMNEAAMECCEDNEIQPCTPEQLENNCVCDDPAGPMSSSSTGRPCDPLTTVTYAGYVDNDANPATKVGGGGIPSVWSYGGFLGVAAGNEMCAQIGADHVCTYKEIEYAHSKGELNGTNLIPETYWLHRVTETVADNNGDMSPPGPGGRCNDWTYPTDHIADGEVMGWDGTDLVYGIDPDTIYTGTTTPIDHADNKDGLSVPESDNCNGSTFYIACCFPECIPEG